MTENRCCFKLSWGINNEPAYATLLFAGPQKKRICPVNTVGLRFQNSRWDHYTFMTPSLSADVKLSHFISHLTEDRSHIKLRRVGLGTVWVRGNIYRSGSNWVLHPGKQYCHKWFRAAESAKLLFGSPAGAILHFTHCKNKTLRLTDCKGGWEGCGSPKMHQHILFPFYCETGTHLGNAA